MYEKEFNTGDPIAYFLTWTTYGTWLPGDGRGWNRKGEFELQQPDFARKESATAELQETPFVLSDTDRETVESTVRNHCEIRKWKLSAVSVRSNHVHVVVAALNYRPDVVVSQFKAWCTRKLKLKHADRSRFWTQGASKRWINQESELAAAIDYTLEAQDCKRVEYE